MLWFLLVFRVLAFSVLNGNLNLICYDLLQVTLLGPALFIFVQGIYQIRIYRAYVLQGSQYASTDDAAGLINLENSGQRKGKDPTWLNISFNFRKAEVSCSY